MAWPSGWLRTPRRLPLLLGTVILLPAVTLILLGVRLLEQDRALAAQRRTELAQSAADRAVRALELEISAVTRRIGDPAWHIDAPEPGTMHVVVSTAGLRVEPVAAVAWYPDRPPLPEPPAAAFAKAEAAEFQAADLAAALALNRRLAVFRAASAGGDVAPDVH